MRVITKGTINRFIALHPTSKTTLIKWYLTANTREWKNFQEIKETFNSVDYVKNDLYVFNIKGNAYRLVARIFFRPQLVYIRFIGTHAEYDKVDLSTL